MAEAAARKAPKKVTRKPIRPPSPEFPPEKYEGQGELLMKIEGIPSQKKDFSKKIPLYLRDFDLTTGNVSMTNNPKVALGFFSEAELREWHGKVSTHRPIRPDGEPNRPLRTFTVSIIDRNDAVKLSNTWKASE